MEKIENFEMTIHSHTYTVNSLMFVGINVCIFETKPCSQGLIFAVIPGLVNYLATWIMFAGICFCNLKMVTNLPNKSLANINEFTVQLVVPAF